MTADDDARDPSAPPTVADALDALVDAGVDMGEAKELANAAVAKGLDGGPFWNALYARQDKLAAARTAALAAIDAAEQAAWRAGLDEGVARGRGEALREVDAAIGAQRQANGAPEGVVGVQWSDDYDGPMWRVQGSAVTHEPPSPTAAILAAAAELAGEVAE